MNALKVGVLGAGIAGLAAAGRLKARGHEVTVFDKGRGPGGRASSRRRGLFHFDHGAQYFTARQEEFSAAVGGWLAAGVVAPWDGYIVSLVGGVTSPLKSETRRYVGQPQMSRLAKHLARELDVRCGVLVDELTRVDGLWMPEEGGEILGAFDRLIVAMPPAQAAQLLEADSPLGGVARSVEMRPCWCVMLGLEARLEVPFDGAFCNESALSWISRDNSKPSRPQTEAWVLHASPEWTEEHLHEDHKELLQGKRGSVHKRPKVAATNPGGLKGLLTHGNTRDAGMAIYPSLEDASYTHLTGPQKVAKRAQRRSSRGSVVSY